MPLTADGPAPYAPPQAVLFVVDAFRNRGLTTPITTDVLLRAGVQESLAPRTLSGLRVLELINDNGEPTERLQNLRKASSDEYQERFAKFVRDVYAEVFNFVDPATDPPERVTDAFRTFRPHGQRERMVTLFLGLCQHAGIIEDVPARRKRATTNRRPPAKPARPSGGNEEPQNRETTRTGLELKRERDAAPPPSAHPLVEGLFKTLPPVGSVWPNEQREMWAKAALANFSLLYKLAPEDNEGVMAIRRE